MKFLAFGALLGLATAMKMANHNQVNHQLTNNRENHEL